jgi:hypothetical protein
VLDAMRFNRRADDARGPIESDRSGRDCPSSARLGPIGEFPQKCQTIRWSRFHEPSRLGHPLEVWGRLVRRSRRGSVSAL